MSDEEGEELSEEAESVGMIASSMSADSMQDDHKNSFADFDDEFGPASRRLPTNCSLCHQAFCYWQGGRTTIRCPHCNQSTDIRIEDEPSSEATFASRQTKTYRMLEEFKDHFDKNNSALVWLARAVPTRSSKLPIPKACRWPKSAAGVDGYASAFRKCGLQLRDGDTKSGHWHYWYVDPKKVDFKALQAALTQRWKESPNHSEQAADLCRLLHSRNNSLSALTSVPSTDSEVERYDWTLLTTSMDNARQFNERLIQCRQHVRTHFSKRHTGGPGILTVADLAAMGMTGAAPAAEASALTLPRKSSRRRRRAEEDSGSSGEDMEDDARVPPLSLSHHSTATPSILDSPPSSGSPFSCSSSSPSSSPSGSPPNSTLSLSPSCDNSHMLPETKSNIDQKKSAPLLPEQPQQSGQQQPQSKKRSRGQESSPVDPISEWVQQQHQQFNPFCPLSSLVGSKPGAAAAASPVAGGGGGISSPFPASASALPGFSSTSASSARQEQTSTDHIHTDPDDVSASSSTRKRARWQPSSLSSSSASPTAKPASAPVVFAAPSVPLGSPAR